MDKCVKKQQKNGWLYILFLLIPILNIYTLGFADLALFCNICVAIYGLVKGIALKKQNFFLILAGLVIIHEFIFYCFYRSPYSSSWLNSIIGMVIFTLAINTFSNKLELKKLYRIWKIVGVVFMIGLLYHSIQYYIFQQNTDIIKIPFLPITSHDAFEKILTIEYTRPRSFFTEPSHYASFMIPLLYLNLLYKDNLYAYLNIITMFLSTSSLGIIFSLYFLILFYLHKTNFKKKILFLLIVIIGYYCFLNLEFLEFARNKLLNSSGNDESSSLRLYFTAMVWADLPIWTKITGIQYATIGEFLTSNTSFVPAGLTWVLNDKSSINYASSFWYVAVKEGIIILIIYILFYIKNIKDSLNTSLVYYAISLLLATFIQSCFLNSIFMTQIVLMFILLKNKNEVNERFYSNNIIRK